MVQITRKTAKKIEAVDADFIDNDELSLSDLENNRQVDQDDDIPDDLAFQSIINELGMSDESGKVNVYKLLKGNYNDQIFLFECSPTEFSLTMLQNPDFHDDGHHKFKVILRNSKNIVRAKQIAVMPNAKLFTNPIEIKTDNGIDIVTALKMMHEQNQALIASIMTKQVNEPVAQKTTMDMLREMQLMKQVMGMDERPVIQHAPQQSPLEVLQLAKELALAMNPDADTGVMSVMGRMLEKYGEPIMSAISSSQQAPAQPVPVRVPIPANPHGITPNPLPQALPAQNNSIESDNQDMSFMLKMYLSQLITQAKRDADVNLYADLILDQVGDDIYQLIEAPDWFERLQTLNGEVTLYRAWFERLKTALQTDVDIDSDEISTNNEIDLTSDDISTINQVTDNLDIADNGVTDTDKLNT